MVGCHINQRDTEDTKVAQGFAKKGRDACRECLKELYREAVTYQSPGLPRSAATLGKS